MFEDAETQRWLGGRDWPSMVLSVNAVLSEARIWLGWVSGCPVTLVGFDLEEDGQAGITYVTASEARRQGWASAALRLMIAAPEASRVRQFRAGVEAGNAASEAVLRGLGLSEQGGVHAETFQRCVLSMRGWASDAPRAFSSAPVTSCEATASWWHGAAAPHEAAAHRTRQRRHPMKYALMIYQPHPYDPKALSPEEYRQVAADYAAVSSAPGVTPGPPMGFAAKATTVRVHDGQAVTSSGPYAGEAHAVGGFIMLEAESLDEAVAMAARVPAARMGGAVEVRPCEVYW